MNMPVDQLLDRATTDSVLLWDGSKWTYGDGGGSPVKAEATVGWRHILSTTHDNLSQSVTTPLTNGDIGVYPIVFTTNASDKKLVLFVNVTNSTTMTIDIKSQGANLVSGDIFTIPAGSLGALSTAVIIQMKDANFVDMKA